MTLRIRHPERANEVSESRDPLTTENVPCSTLSGEFWGSFDSALRASLRMTLCIRHPERANVVSESRDPLTSENVPCSALSGEFWGSFDSALRASLRMTRTEGPAGFD